MSLDKYEIFWEFLEATETTTHPKRCVSVALMTFLEHIERFAKDNTTCDCENCMIAKGQI